MEKASKRPVVLIWIATILVCLCAAYALATRPNQQDSFTFLHGQRPFLTGAMAPLDCYLGAKNPPRSLSEYRVYSWLADYKSVKAEIDKEVRGLGYRLTYDKASCCWSNGDKGIWLEQGSSYNRDQALNGKRRGPGVTVTTGNDIPDTLVNRFRTWIEPAY